MRYGRAYILAILTTGFIVTLSSQSALAQDSEVPVGGTAGTEVSNGPDVIVSDLVGIITHQYENTLTGLITAYSIGTVSCNIGNVPLQWQELPSHQHPVIRSSMYRLKNGRFEQIGMSWVKHGFFATNDPICGAICTAPGQHGGASLYPGCGDPYSAGLNALQSGLGPTWQINAHTGTFTTPSTSGTAPGQARRLQVHNVDLDPALNPNARYYFGAQYIAADDAAAGNGNNNFSHQRAFIVPAPAFPSDTCTGDDPNKFCAYFTDFLRETESPIRAWKHEDPSVVETDAQVPGEGLFILAARATDLGTGFWRYEYALQNVNSDRSGKAFTVPITIGAAVTNVGFHDVDYHSGEPFSNDDWQVSVLSGKIIWSTADFATNPNANALRWGTLYNFRFDCNSPPTAPGSPTTVALDLFKPGAPDKINITTVGPVVGLIDCNKNGIADSCDVDCGGLGCVEPCGTSEDCNNNGVPDECEDDCNENGIADTCDIVPRCVGGDDAGDACEFDADCDSNDCVQFSEDCNENTVPDECEEDCNNNGIPDNCEELIDCDGDGLDDCVDLCPCSTPVGGCAPPPFVCCLYQSGISIPNYPYTNCLSDGGAPLCHGEFQGYCGDDDRPPACPTSFCRNGCLVGDSDDDGDFDIADFYALIQCYSGEEGSPAFVQPSESCRTTFDFDENGAVDLLDVEQFRRLLAGPGGL